MRPQLLRRSEPKRRQLRVEQLESRYVLSTTLLVSEFLASNNDGVVDENGDSSDWIEIFNSTATGINVDGWHLTDDADELDKWQLPSQTIGPGEYLVVFASGKDRTPSLAGELHTNFQLAADGEYVGLVRPDGTTVEHQYPSSYPTPSEYPPQRNDVSYGIDPTSPSDGPYYYETPTPGAAQGAGAIGIASEPSFSVERGFYTTSQLVTLYSSTPAASIRYTTDGSTPTNSHGMFYTGGILVDETTSLRAAAYRTDYLLSEPVTHTYVFPNDVVQQSPGGQAPAGWPTGPAGPHDQRLDYGMDPDIVGGQYTTQEVIESLTAIPSVSIVTDLDNLFEDSWNEETGGIYIHAYERWERPTSVELIDPDGTPGFQIDAGLRLRGGYSRSPNNPRHAFRLLFRGEYDGTLDFPLFDEEGADSFHKVDLRTAQNYSWAFSSPAEASFSREVFSRDTQRDMGYEYTRTRHYHLYLNGQYWGLFETQERSEADFAATYFGGTDSDYDVLKVDWEASGGPTSPTDGTIDAWSSLWNLAVAMDVNPVAGADNYWTMQGLNPDGTRNESLSVLLDVDALIDYMILIFYTGNGDAPLSNFISNNHANNWYGIYNHTTQDRGFQYFAHDNEHTLGTSGSQNDRTGPFDLANGSSNERSLFHSNPQFLHQHLMNHAEYRLRFADRAQKHLLGGGVLTAAANTARYLERVNQVAPSVLAESARWGDAQNPDNPYLIPHWQAQVDEVFGFFNGRSEVVIHQLAEDGLFPDIDAPIFSASGGHVPASFPLSIANTNGTGIVLYTLDGNDPRQIGGAANPSAFFYNATTTPTTLLAAGSTWRYLDDGSDQGAAWAAVGFDDNGWSSGPAELGYGDGGESTTVGFIDTDPVEPETQKNITTYFRTTFSVADTSNLVNQTLRLVRDDGAIVHINGQEVTRANLPGALGTPVDYRQTASAVVSDADESTFFEFTIPAGMLVTGENTIAVEIHQVSPTSSDISFDLELIANAVSQPILLNESATIKARVFDFGSGTWSALSEAAFVVDAVPADASSFRITEINYHPSDPTAAELATDPNLEDDDFEFIELRNVSSGQIDLAGVEFVQVDGDGVAFDFTGSAITELAPGDFALVVEDTDAFAIRYGTGMPVAGQWSGKLGNGGEQLSLRDVAGSTIHSFAYDDEAGWPTAPDGDGPTLVVIDTFGDYGDPANWRASLSDVGTPGAAEIVPGDFDGDADVDGDDFLKWQAGFGQFPGGGATTADGDADGDGDVDGDDFLLWQANFGGGAIAGGAATLGTIESQSPPVVTHNAIRSQYAGHEAFGRADWVPRPRLQPADAAKETRIAIGERLPPVARDRLDAIDAVFEANGDKRRGRGLRSHHAPRDEAETGTRPATKQQLASRQTTPATSLGE